MAKTATVTALTESKPIRRKVNLRTPVGKINTHWVGVEHTEDPKRAIFSQIGKVPAELVQFSRILVAIYKPPMVEKIGSIFMTETMKDEDRQEVYWQGKVGLIVAMGPQAYVDDENTKFHGTSNAVGDWVWFRPSDGDAVEVNEVFCRIFDSERFIKGRIPHPDYVW